MRHRYVTRLLVLFSTLLLLLGLSSVPASAAEDTSISGTVYGPYDTETGIYPPLSGATVKVVQSTNENATVATATTAADGTYSIEGIVPGDYKVRFSADPALYLPQWYSYSSTFAGAWTASVEPGVHLTDVNGYLQDATTSISGTVFGAYDSEADEYDTVSGATVKVVSADDENATVATATTAADGTFLIEGFAPGDYKVHFSADPALYVPQWYSYSSTFAGAWTASVEPGVHLTDLNGYLQDATTSISGTVFDINGDEFSGVTVETFLDDNLTTPAATRTTASDGTYRFDGLAAGSYRVRFSAGEDYAVQWYSAATNAANAWTVTIEPGTHQEYIDATLAAPGHEWLDVPTPTISGTPTVGSTLTAVPGTWDPVPTSFTYQWSIDGAEVAGATNATFVVPASAKGSEITVDVIAHKALFPSQSSSSEPMLIPGWTVAEVATAMDLPSGITLTIPGDAAGVAIGDQAVTGFPRQGASFVVLSNGKAKDAAQPGVPSTFVSSGLAGLSGVDGNDLSQLVLQVAPQASAECVVMDFRFGTEEFPEYVNAGVNDLFTMESPQSAITLTEGGVAQAPNNYAFDVDGDIISVDTAGLAEISGTVLDGMTPILVAAAPIPTTADGRIYISIQDRGDSVFDSAVFLDKVRFGSGTACDSNVAVPVDPIVGPVPTISGHADVGATLTAVPGTWTPAPVELAYQWLRDGEPIDGAIGATYQVSAADEGTRLSVQVTGSKAGYLPVVKTSTETDEISGPVSGTITGLVVGTDGLPPVGLDVCLRDEGPFGPRTYEPGGLDASGRYTFTNIPSGEYHILFQVSGSLLCNSAPPADAAYQSQYYRFQETWQAATPIVIDSQEQDVELQTVVITASGELFNHTSPTIAGTAKVGSTLTAGNGGWFPAPGTVTREWLADGVPISGATGATYVLTGAEAGKVIIVRETASRDDFTTKSAVSQPTAVVASGTLSPTPTPTISGTAKVGSVLTAAAGAWGPGTVALTYQWKSGGANVGTNSTTYTPAASDVGKTITVTVTGSRIGYASQSKTSAPTAVVTGNVITGPIPKITGTAKVGSQLTASPGTWAPTPVTLKYQWKSGTTNVGTNSASYTLVGTDHGKKITVTVTGTKTGYTSVAKTSASTAAVAAGTLTAPTPKISGTAKVGSKLTVVPGTWGPSTVTRKYQWKANGASISGATGSTYTLPGSVKGKKITVTVTGSKTGYTTVAKTSAATATVAAGTLKGATPKINGTARVGVKLSVSTGAWGPAPVVIKYQWKANGASISGATKSTYTIASSAKGKKITVTVTGSKTGYTSLAKTSAGTATVK